MIELRDIRKNLDGKQVLDGLSFVASKGTTTVVVGPSGTGKSVTLQHMVGLMRPDTGTVMIDGLDINKINRRKLAGVRERIGMLFQSGALINWLNVYDNVALPLYEKTKLKDKEIREIVEEKLALVGLEGAGKKFPGEISGGMKKRAGLARAIVRHPDIILYDEPTSGLDPVMSRNIDGLINKLRKQLGVTSVVVTHDLQSAKLVADRIVMLSNGRVLCDLAPDEFMSSEIPEVREFVEAQFAEY